MRPGYVPTAEARLAQQQWREAELRFLSSPMYFWDKALGGHLAASFATAPVFGEGEQTVTTNLRDAIVAHARKGQELRQAARRWRPDPANPTKAMDGSDLDSHPPEYRARKLKEAQKAIESWDADAVRVLNPLIDEAQREPQQKLQLGTRLSAGDTGEVTLLVQQYRDLTRQQQAELGRLGMAAIERGDLTAALQYKRAAEVLHVGTPEFDEALGAKDPVRQEAKGQLDHVRRMVETFQADQARVHVGAGTADSTELIGLQSWAQQHNLDPDGDGSYVESVLSAQ